MDSRLSLYTSLETINSWCFQGDFILSAILISIIASVLPQNRTIHMAADKHLSECSSSIESASESVGR